MTQHNENRGRDQNIINQAGTVIIQGQEYPVRPRNQSILLQAVKDEVKGRLQSSLHQAVMITLDKQTQPEQVHCPWEAEVKIGSKPAQPLPSETRILDVFEQPEIAGRLLILGEPGVGKTTTLLDLANILLQRAETQTNYPIPVLFDLSNWKDPHQLMDNWVLAELNSKYGVKRKIGQQWLNEKYLLPLLDGLDEVKPEHQVSCVAAINQWLQKDTRPLSLVVCCRREEYETIVRGRYQPPTPAEPRLHLNGAILLSPLTPKKIQHYLVAINCPELWLVLQKDAVLLELVQIPLLLSITLLSYQELSSSHWHSLTSTHQRLEALLDAYIQRMLHRETLNRAYSQGTPPTAKQTRHRLVALAQQMQQISRTEFSIEEMLPFWLKTIKQVWIYQLILKLLKLALCQITVGWFTTLIMLPALLVSVVRGDIGLEQSLETAVFLTVLGLAGGTYLGLVFVLVSVVVDLLWKRLNLLGKRLMDKLKVDDDTRNLIPFASIFIFVIPFFLTQFLWRIQNVDLTKQLHSPALFGIQWGWLMMIYLFLYISLMLKIAVTPFQDNFSYELNNLEEPVLQFLVYVNNYTPQSYARFLNYCTERLLLQRIGGRYRFMHKLLQEHFAEMGNGESLCERE